MSTDNFSNLKEKIKASKKRNDILEVCSEIKVKRGVFTSAMNKNTYEELTTDELKMVEAVVHKIEEREERINKLAKKC